MRLPNTCRKANDLHPEKGIALFVVIIVMAFILTLGVALLTVTGTGPKVAGNIRDQQEAFNAAEAGFDTAWTTIGDFFAKGSWSSFEGHYLKEPYGIDIPSSQENYFRRLTDIELLNLIDPDGDGISNLDNVLFFKRPYIIDYEGQLETQYTYTVFLIDDETGSGTSDSSDAIMVCIGCIKMGASITTSRLEIGLGVELPGAKT